MWFTFSNGFFSPCSCRFPDHRGGRKHFLAGLYRSLVHNNTHPDSNPNILLMDVAVAVMSSLCMTTWWQVPKPRKKRPKIQTLLRTEWNGPQSSHSPREYPTVQVTHKKGMFLVFVETVPPCLTTCKIHSTNGQTRNLLVLSRIRGRVLIHGFYHQDVPNNPKGKHEAHWSSTRLPWKSSLLISGIDKALWLVLVQKKSNNKIKLHTLKTPQTS